MHHKNHNGYSENAAKSQPPLLAKNKKNVEEHQKNGWCNDGLLKTSEKLELGFSAIGPGVIASLSLCVFQRPDRNQEPDE